MTGFPARPVARLLIVALLVFPGLTSCGFRALHGTEAPASSARLATVKIAPIANRTGQKLHNLLRDRLNPHGQPSKPVYVLQVSLQETVQNLAVRKDEIATRANLIVTATYTLTQRRTKKKLFGGISKSTNSYNILQSYFGTLSAENDARSRAVRVLASEIRNRIGIFLSQPPATTR